MRIIRPEFLKKCRVMGRCEHCGKLCKKREGHHLFTTGAGRLDMACNVMLLGSTVHRACECHTRIQNGGQAAREKCLEIVAKREGTTAEAIRDCVWFVRDQLNRDDSEFRILEKIAKSGLSAEAKALVMRELRLAEKIR